MDTDPHCKLPLPDGPAPTPGGSTVAQLKDDIDQGRTGDRARSGDPGLSMLGTDDEAGGHPNSPELIDQMRKLETGRSNGRTDTAQAPGAHSQGVAPKRFGLLLSVAVALVLIVIAYLMLAGG